MLGRSDKGGFSHCFDQVGIGQSDGFFWMSSQILDEEDEWLLKGFQFRTEDGSGRGSRKEGRQSLQQGSLHLGRNLLDVLIILVVKAISIGDSQDGSPFLDETLWFWHQRQENGEKGLGWGNCGLLTGKESLRSQALKLGEEGLEGYWMRLHGSQKRKMALGLDVL